MSTKAQRHRRRAVSAVLAAAALASVLGATPASAQSGPPRKELDVGAGKSEVLEFSEPYADVMVADPKIADVMPLTNHSLYVVGKAVGATAITVYVVDKHVVSAANVVVSADIEGLKARLHEILPAEKDIAARAANQSIVLFGTASSPAVLQQIVTLADTYAPGKVVNMLSVEGVQQVMLSVRFVEMERSTAKNLRLNLQTQPGKSFAVKTGDTLLNDANGTLATFGNISGLIQTANGDLSVLLDALETKGLVKTLAEPNLVAMSGDTANFLAGGEFPIPVASNASGAGGVATITIAFKQFGIALAFTPTVLKDGLINLVVNPEVSSIDPTTSVTTGGVTVPGLKVRRAHTTVELRDGESFTVAGLLKDDYQSSINQFPFLGDLPVLGALFRSTGYQHDETELVIVVTPHLVTPRRGRIALPTDHFVPPSDFELFLLGAQHGSSKLLAPEDRALMSADPTQGGVDGPHGHVLY
jgi:pilus assembly protein CpaC